MKRSDDSYLPCPECAADNVVYRETCWRCGGTLPYSLGLDGLMHHNSGPPATAVIRPEAERLLEATRSLAIDADKQRQETIGAKGSYKPQIGRTS